MNCITVFVVNQEEQLKNLIQDTRDILSHRMFILNNFDFDKKKCSYILPSDLLINYNSDKFLTEEIVQRMSLMYTEPLYEKILIPYGDFTFSDVENVINTEYKESSSYENLAIIIREDAILNGIKFVKINVIPDNILEESDMMFSAMNEEPVNEEYFNKALNEIIPYGNFDFTSITNFEIIDILEKYSDKNAKNIIKIFYNPSSQINHKSSLVVIDNNFELENYSFVIKRLDGLKIYLV